MPENRIASIDLINTRSRAALTRAGVLTLEDAALKTDDELRAIEGVGQYSIDVIRRELRRIGVEYPLDPKPETTEAEPGVFGSSGPAGWSVETASRIEISHDVALNILHAFVEKEGYARASTDFVDRAWQLADAYADHLATRIQESKRGE